MSSKAEQQRRKALTREIAQRQRAEEIAAMPLAQEQLAQLFDYLDGALAAGCDHSLKLTRQFLQTNSLAEATIIPWLASYGGHCDILVLGSGATAFVCWGLLGGFR